MPTYPLTWDQTGEHFYEAGVDHCVLYKYAEADAEVVGDTAGYKNGVAWNGITAFNESPSGAEPSAFYADNIKYLNMISAEDYGATVECFTYPEEFEECNGNVEIADGVYISQQARAKFGVCYRTLTGSDTVTAGSDPLGYKLHLVYNCSATPSEKSHTTVNESPDAPTMSFTLSTTPVEVSGKKPTAVLTIDAAKVGQAKMAALEAVLYGSGSTAPRLPYPDEIAEILGNEALGSIELNMHTVTIKNGGSATLTAKVYPANAEITWTSGSSSVATVSDGVVSAEGVGNTVITAAITVSGVTYNDTCTVIVEAAS